MGEGPESSDARRALTVLGRPWWQGVGAVIGLIALITALVAYCVPRGADPPKPSAPSVVIEGDCNAQGSGNSVTCLTPTGTASFGKVKINWEASGYRFSGSPQELPTPPPYDLNYLYSHCPDWLDWGMANPRIYLEDMMINIYLTAGSPDLVAIRRVRVPIFKRGELSKITTTAIQCRYGADSFRGYFVKIPPGGDIAKVTAEELSKDETFSMPPGTLSVTGAEVRTILLKVEEAPGTYFEGAIEIDAEVNGELRTVRLGSSKNPLRWADADSVLGVENGYDWNIPQQQWLCNPTQADIYPGGSDLGATRTPCLSASTRSS